MHYKWPPLKYSCKYFYVETTNTYIYIQKVSEKIIGENTILVPTFWDHSQFGLYILVAVNLVPVIFKLHSIWSLPLIY